MRFLWNKRNADDLHKLHLRGQQLPHLRWRACDRCGLRILRNWRDLPHLAGRGACQSKKLAHHGIANLDRPELLVPLQPGHLRSSGLERQRRAGRVPRQRGAQECVIPEPRWRRHRGTGRKPSGGSEHHQLRFLREHDHERLRDSSMAIRDSHGQQQRFRGECHRIAVCDGDLHRHDEPWERIPLHHRQLRLRLQSRDADGHRIRNNARCHFRHSLQWLERQSSELHVFRKLGVCFRRWHGVGCHGDDDRRIRIERPLLHVFRKHDHDRRIHLA